jgi:hypothetical protein
MTLRYTSTLGPAARLFLFVAGLVPLLAPYELLLRPAWTTYASPAFVLAVVISAGAVAVSLLMLAAAIAGVDEEVRFDPAGRVVVHRSRSPVAPVRVRRIPFDGIATLEIEAVQWDSRADTFRLRLGSLGERTVHLGAFNTREAAEHARREILSMLSPAAPTTPLPDAGRDHGTENSRG